MSRNLPAVALARAANPIDKTEVADPCSFDRGKGINITVLIQRSFVPGVLTRFFRQVFVRSAIQRTSSRAYGAESSGVDLDTVGSRTSVSICRNVLVNSDPL